MVTAAMGYGSHIAPSSYRAIEPPGVIEMRLALEHALMVTFREFTNQSLQATALGIEALEAGDYITLDALEAMILKK